MLKCGNQSMETEVWKLKYESENKCLIVCRGLVAKRWLNPCDGCENRIVGSRTAASFTVACDSQTQVKTNGEWAKYMDYVPGKSCQWCRCKCCHSSSPMAQPATKLLQRHSQILTVVLEWDHNKDYTHCVMLNNCVSPRWSPKYQCLALTSLRDSYPLPTSHSRESVMH